MEMARVAFSFASSISCCRTLGSVFVTLSPADWLSFPARSARANWRCVCRRPAGVVYQSASSVSDLNLGTLVDLGGILPPLCRIHFIGGHGTKQLPTNREHH